MNKKILSIFALIMAISILGVSCAKDGNGVTNPPTPALGLDDAKKVIEAMSTVTANTAGFNLAAVKDDVVASGTDYVVTVENSDNNKTVTPAQIKTELDKLKATMGGAVTPDNITIGSIKVDAPSADNKSVVATIPYTTSDGKTGNFKITFKFADTATGSTFSGEAAEDTPIELSAIQSDIVTKALGGTSGISVVAAGTESANTGSDNGQTFKFTAATGDATAITGTGEALNTAAAVDVDGFVTTIKGKITSNLVNNVTLTVTESDTTNLPETANELVITVTAEASEGYIINGGTTITITITPEASGWAATE